MTRTEKNKLKKKFKKNFILGMMQQNGKLATKWDVNPMEKMNKIFACY